MSLNRPDDSRGEDLITAIWNQRSSDPIARNPKDIGDRQGKVEAAEVSRASRVPVAAGSTPLLPGHSWGPNQHMQAGLSPTELLTSILRFKWTIVLVSILISAPMVAAVWTLVIPKYEARAEIRVRPIIPRLVFRTDENGMIPLYDSFVNTQASIIRSPTVLQRVLDLPEIQKTEWYRNPPKSFVQRLLGNPPPPHTERLRDGLSVRPRARTEIVDVSFTDPSAQDARKIVDAVLDQYIRYSGDVSSEDEKTLDKELQDQYRVLESEIKGRQGTVAGLHNLLGTELPQELVSSRRLRLEQTQARLNDLGSQIAVLQWEMSQIAGRDSNEVSVAAGGEADKQPRYYADAEWRRLDLGVRTTQHQIANSRYAPNNPERIRLAKDLEFAQELLRLREVQLDEQWQDQSTSPGGALFAATETSVPGGEDRLVPVEYRLARAKHEEELLQAEVEKQAVEFKTVFENAQLLEKENTELRNKRELFDAVRQRLDQKNMERNVPGAIKVQTPAFAPSKPQQDRRIVFTAMVLFMGLGVGGGAAFLRASRDQCIYTPKDMPQPMQAPFLGHVPLIPSRKLLGKSLGDEFEQYQLSLIESVRVMRTTLLSRLNSQGSTSVLITSATTGTGKSSFTIILGKSLAQAGRNVLMIDADFHKMTLSKRFDLLDRPGLIDALGCALVDKQHIFPTETPGLSIMPAGKRGNSGIVFEEIANGAFKACIGQLAEQDDYDIILLDGSPILPVADATIIAGQVDGTIMVEREHVSQRAEVAEAFVRLGATGGHLLGTVFVGSPGHKGSGYGYGGSYRYHYSKSKES